MESQPNFHEISRERKVLRKTLNEEPESIKPVIEETIEPLNEKAKEFSQEYPITPERDNSGKIVKLEGLGKGLRRVREDKVRGGKKTMD